MQRIHSSMRQIMALLRAGKLDPMEFYEQSVVRMRRLQHLNAFITDMSESAQRQAEEAAERFKQGSALGPLDGVPVAVKDNFTTRGTQTSCASRILTGYKPPYTATVVQRMLGQGAVLMGKTNLDEFAMGCGTVDGVFGPTKNPWTYHKKSHTSSRENESRSPLHQRPLHPVEEFCTSGGSAVAAKGPEVEDFRISGGSSGGSAVAVATGMTFAALGSDTGGSVRNPASYCGVVGLKPTYGRLSRHGLIPLVNSLDVPGIFTRCVDDAATVLNVLSGYDVMDSTTVTDKHDDVTLPDDVTVSDLHIGIPVEYHAPGISPETVSAWTRVADLLENSGAKVTQVSLPHTQYSIVTYHILCACEVASNMARYDGIEFGHRAAADESTDSLYAVTRSQGFNQVVRGRILAGNYLCLRDHYAEYTVRAHKVRRLITQDFNNVFRSGVDLLLTPTVLGDAPWFSEFSQSDNRTRTQEQDVFTQPVNIAGIPAVNIPVTLSSSSLPIGLQLIAPNFQEQTLLRAAKWIEQQVNFPQLEIS